MDTDIPQHCRKSWRVSGGGKRWEGAERGLTRERSLSTSTDGGASMSTDTAAASTCNVGLILREIPRPTLLLGLNCWNWVCVNLGLQVTKQKEELWSALGDDEHCCRLTVERGRDLVEVMKVVVGERHTECPMVMEGVSFLASALQVGNAQSASQKTNSPDPAARNPKIKAQRVDPTTSYSL